MNRFKVGDMLRWVGGEMRQSETHAQYASNSRMVEEVRNVMRVNEAREHGSLSFNGSSSWYRHEDFELARPTHINGVKIPPTATHYHVSDWEVILLRRNKTDTRWQILPSKEAIASVFKSWNRRVWTSKRLNQGWCDKNAKPLEDYYKPEPLAKLSPKELF